MTIHLSCGHVAEDGCFGVDVSWEGEDCVAGEGFVPTTFYASYCHKCAMDLARTKERDAIVAWLMREEENYPSTEYSRFAAMICVEIEEGKHLK
jgi:hypothetical protein